jgi:hypothetical protein
MIKPHQQYLSIPHQIESPTTRNNRVVGLSILIRLDEWSSALSIDV